LFVGDAERSRRGVNRSNLREKHGDGDQARPQFVANMNLRGEHEPSRQARNFRMNLRSEPSQALTILFIFHIQAHALIPEDKTKSSTTFDVSYKNAKQY